MDLSDVPVVDGHCHSFTAEHQRIDEQQLRDVLLFMQEGGASAEALDTLTAHLFIRHLAELLGCAPDLAEVVRVRNHAAAVDYAGYVERVLTAARVKALLVDTGYPYWKRVNIDECSSLVTDRQVSEVFRVESAFGSRGCIYFEGAPLNFGAYVDRFRDACVAAVRERGCVAFKTVIAYRPGLAVHPVSEGEARAAYESRADVDIDSQKVVRDYLFNVTARVAAELGVPLTIHTGFTGMTQPWSYGDPTSLIPALTQPDVSDTTFVLLHGGYPWGGAAGYMAAHHPNIYVDLSEVIPSTSIGIEKHFEEVLEFAPLGKVMLGSDGLAIPEMHGYGLTMATRALGNILDRLLVAGVLRPEHAERYAGLICHGTAERLYGLPA